MCLAQRISLDSFGSVTHATARLESSARVEETESALAASIAIGQGLEADRDRLLQQVALLSAQCTEFRFQLRQAESLKADLEAAERLD